MMELNDEKERRLGDDGSREGDGQSGRQGPREESLASGPQADRVGRREDAMGQTGREKGVMLKLTPDNCRTHSDEIPEGFHFPRPLLRIMTEGFGAAMDSDVEAELTKHGCTIASVSESPTVGTWTGGMLRELIYTTPKSETLHMYLIASHQIDTWQEEWIISAQPLTSAEAADLIEEARKIAFPLSYGATI